MRKKVLATTVLSLIATTTLTGFGLNDLVDDLKPDLDKCEDASSERKCKNKEYLKSAAKTAAVVVATKIISDMIVDFTSSEVKDSDRVSSDYLSKNKELPEKATVVTYNSSINPGEIVATGKPTSIDSYLEVVASRTPNDVVIEEKISIYDNEDSSLLIKSMVKQVNVKNQRAGAFKNQFSFTLPEGMPQGVYPIKTSVIIDGAEQKNTDTHMQVVLQVLPNQQYRIAALSEAFAG